MIKLSIPSELCNSIIDADTGVLELTLSEDAYRAYFQRNLPADEGVDADAMLLRLEELWDADRLRRIHDSFNLKAADPDTGWRLLTGNWAASEDSVELEVLPPKGNQFDRLTFKTNPCMAAMPKRILSDNLEHYGLHPAPETAPDSSTETAQDSLTETAPVCAVPGDVLMSSIRAFCK